jgi:plasmid stability protein
MAQFLIKDFPDELLKAAKIRALEEGPTLQHLIVRATRHYLRGKKEEEKCQHFGFGGSHDRRS